MNDKKWIGGSLPPPGIECEVLFDGINYARCFIVAHDEDRAVYRVHREENDMSLIEYAGEVFTWEYGQASFLPILTPEQIAADEKQIACDEMFQVLLGVKELRADIRCDMAVALYEAGYRKTEEE